MLSHSQCCSHYSEKNRCLCSALWPHNVFCVGRSLILPFFWSADRSRIIAGIFLKFSFLWLEILQLTCCFPLVGMRCFYSQVTPNSLALCKMLEAEVSLIQQRLHTLVPSGHHCTEQPLIKQGSCLELNWWAWSALFWLVHFGACASSPKSIYNLVSFGSRWVSVDSCIYFNECSSVEGGCFQSGCEWAVLGKPQCSCMCRCSQHDCSYISLFLKTLFLFPFQICFARPEILCCGDRNFGW